MPQSLKKTGAAALGLNRPRTVKGAFNPSMVNNVTNQGTTKSAGDSGCCTIFSGLASKCFFWMEPPDLAGSNDPASLSFEDRATSDEDSGDEESDKEEENRASGRNSHSTSIKIP